MGGRMSVLGSKLARFKLLLCKWWDLEPRTSSFLDECCSNWGTGAKARRYFSPSPSLFLSPAPRELFSTTFSDVICHNKSIHKGHAHGLCLYAWPQCSLLCTQLCTCKCYIARNRIPVWGVSDIFGAKATWSTIWKTKYWHTGDQERNTVFTWI